MTTHELARLLLQGPDILAIVRGYEGGYDPVVELEPLDVVYTGERKFFGCYETPGFDEGPTVPAIHLAGGSAE